MKTKNLMIGILTIAVVTLGILLFQEKQKACPNDDSSGNRSAACQFSSTDSCCVDITSRLEDVYTSESACFDTTGCGAYFEEDSVEYIRKLIKDAKLRNVHNQIYGYQINLKHIDEMYGAIHKFNAGGGVIVDGDTLTVSGVRFYEAVSERVIAGRKRRKADLVMIPYLSSGKDVFVVDLPRPIVGNFKMYSHFRPCPKLCGDESLYIHQ